MSSDIHGKPSFPARLEGWEYQYKRAEKAEAHAADCKKLLLRVSNWFRAYYSYVYMDEEVMKLWKEIDDELDKELDNE